jgi:prevent-host-death family protein
MNIYKNTVSARELQRQYQKIVAKIQKQGEPVLIISQNKPQVVLVSIEMMERLIST